MSRDFKISEWHTKQQAAAIIGVSTKTIEKMAADKKLQHATRPQIGRPPVVVYHPKDVERLRQERQPSAEPYVLPDNASVPEPRPNGTTKLDLAAMFENLSRTSEVRISERVYLTLPEASVYSGLPRTHLQNLIKQAKLPALKTGAGWRIRRKDIEAL